MSGAGALLALADGTCFEGRGVGAEGVAVGEVVFNTAMSGYQEILTDPSYHRQIVCFTNPHIGNVGVNPEDAESDRVQVAGALLRDLSPRVAGHRGRQPLDAHLRERDIPAAAGVDTRALVHHLRERGSMPGCLIVAQSPDRERALAAARDFAGLAGMDLARVVGTGDGRWEEGDWNPDGGFRTPDDLPLHVAAYDFGVKRSVLRHLVAHGARVTLLPATAPAAEALALKPDGVFLSNGPGDPEPCDYAIAAIGELLESGMPLFGVCLGHQLLSLACGARTVKMKFGHHGGNHPVRDIDSGRVLVTSQNHGFAVDEASLPETLRPTHRSLFDGSLQGVRHTRHPAFGFQGHPEAGPGPADARGLFARFADMMRERR